MVEREREAIAELAEVGVVVELYFELRAEL